MDSIDGTDVNMLQYFKDNNIPHTYQCSRCGAWRGDEPYAQPFCTHTWVIRDLRPFQKDGIQNEISDRNDSI